MLDLFNHVTGEWERVEQPITTLTDEQLRPYVRVDDAVRYYQLREDHSPIECLLTIMMES